MKRYRVTIYFSEIYEVDAEDVQEAKEKANMRLRNFNSIPIPEEYEVECFEEE